MKMRIELDEAEVKKLVEKHIAETIPQSVDKQVRVDAMAYGSGYRIEITEKEAA